MGNCVVRGVRWPGKWEHFIAGSMVLSDIVCWPPHSRFRSCQSQQPNQKPRPYDPAHFLRPRLFRFNLQLTDSLTLKITNAFWDASVASAVRLMGQVKP